MPRKSPHPRRAAVIRVIVSLFAWVFYLLFSLACVSYSPNDTAVQFRSGAFAYHNWCGAFGANIAEHTLAGAGPGIFVAIVLLGIALVLWTRGQPLTQLPLRIIGSAMLVAVVSTFFNLCSFAPDSGGNLGIALGTLLHHYFHFGAWIILFASLVVGGLLVADEIVLGLPAKMLWIGKRMPTEQVANVAAGAAGGMWGGLRSMIDSLSRNQRAKKPRRQTPDARPGLDTAPDSSAETATAVLDAPAPTSPDSPSAADDEPIIVPAIPVDSSEPIVRKPSAPKGPSVPFKPAPAPSQKQDLGHYRLPGLDLLDEPEPVDTVGQEQRVREKAKILEATLASFGIEGKVEAIDTGPVVTLYELSLAPGIKSSQVAALSKDIARALKSPPVRLIDNIPGKSTMGIEVPNLDRERVRLKDLFQIGHDRIAKMALPMCLGKDASGAPLIEDLAKMPHLLLAGTTGSGKSVCLNSIIMTMLLTQRPDHVKLILVDPKMVEMQDYKMIPHLMAPIIDDMSKAESILEWATQKMDERYETMAEANVRHIKEYNKLTKLEIIERFNAHTEEDQAKIQFHMPYIVIIIDELADLMMTSKEVEGHIVRIAQKARAVGIHLILSTQRPEAQVVTGLIKSNMPGRICFQVRSRLDSRIMLDQSGGELLLGQGDMLMLKPTGAGLLRAQGAFVDDKEIKNIGQFLKEIAEPEFHPELMQLGTSQGLAEGEEKDPLYNDAVDIMIETGRGSVSLIQRRLNIGYSRASRLIDQMRRTGIVGAYKGSMASEVVITKEQWDQLKAETARSLGGDGSDGSTGGRTGTGQNAGYAQQTSTSFDESDDDDAGGVPNEMPGEHRM
jgi:DNA segregation ATPase FtsK/SpoIIIE, S-DNA-T family